MGDRDLGYIPLADIVENKVALRSVDTEGEAFKELVASIREKGILDSINVRPRVSEETGETKYEIINGLHRVTAARELGLAEVPAQIITADEAEVLEMQIVANLQRVETKPTEYTKQLRRMLNMHPMWTQTDLAQKLGKSPQWVQDRLSLSKIENEVVKQLIDDGTIKLGNAYALTKLPPEELADWIESAQTQDAAEFVPRVNARVKEVAEARRKGRDAAPAVFEPQAHGRKVRELKDELETGEVGAAMAADPASFAMAVKWALHLDDASVAEQKAKWEEREAAREEAKKRREAEKAKKAAAAAREKAEKAAAAAEAAETAAADAD